MPGNVCPGPFVAIGPIDFGKSDVRALQEVMRLCGSGDLTADLHRQFA